MIDDFGDFPESSSGSGGSSAISTPLVADVYWMRQTTAPTKSKQQIAIPSASRIRSPSNSAPSILNSRRKENFIKETKNKRKNSAKKVDIFKINHVGISNNETDEATNIPGTLNPPPNSKSDGDLLAVTKINNIANNHIPNSHSESYLKKQEQCCTGFGTANGKPTFTSNNCVLI